MRIGLVFSGCHPRGGVERVVWEAANYLDPRHEVTVITAQADPLPSSVSVELIDPPAGGVREPFRFRDAASRAMERHSFDLSVSFGSNCPPGDVLVVQSVHKAWVERGTPVRVGAASVPGMVRRVMPGHLARLRAESQWFGRAPDATVVAVSEGVAEDLQHYYGVQRSALRVIPNGFSPSQCSAARRRELRPEMRERLDLRADEVALLLVANEWHRKGLGVVLRAIARVRDPRVRLLLVGRQAPTAYQGLIRQLGLHDQVRWYGVADDVAEYHAAADLFVMPTAYEAFGSVIVEALGSGLPVITSAIAGAAAAVEEDGNGLLQLNPSDDAELARLLRRALTPGVLARWSATAAASVAEYTWPAVMQRFEAALVEHAARKIASADRRSSGFTPVRSGAPSSTVGSSNRRIRVAFVDHCAKLSGGELALSRLLPALEVDAHVVLAEEGPLVQLLEQDGIETTVLPMRRTTRDLSRDRVVLGPAAVRAVVDTSRYVWRLRGWLRSQGVDVVHTNSLKAAVYGGLAGRLAGIPVVWHVRDRIADDYLPASAVRFVRLLSHVLPSSVVANSKATSSTLPRPAHGLRRVLVLGDVANAAEVHVVYNAADFGESDAPDAGGREDLLVGLVGRLAPWKGQHVFLRAFAEAFPGSGRAVLIGSAMFGEEAYERSLQELVRELGIEDRVDFVGFREDVPAELRTLDIFVHASTIPEPFGQVIIEAMAAGLPVIAGGAGGPLEIITDGVDGLFHKPGDIQDLAAVMQRLAKDPELRRRLGAAAQVSVERFRPERIAAEMMMIYYEVLTR